MPVELTCAVGVFGTLDTALAKLVGHGSDGKRCGEADVPPS
jgi:hypothetical protein